MIFSIYFDTIFVFKFVKKSFFWLKNDLNRKKHPEEGSLHFVIKDYFDENSINQRVFPYEWISTIEIQFEKVCFS